MNHLHDIPVTDKDIETFVYGLIEIPQGSHAKFEYDKDYGLIRLDRVLYTSTQYPTNYGFIPQTHADDGDPLDILVLCTERLPPGTLVRARVIGVFIMEDNGEMDEKILAVAYDDPSYKHVVSIDQISPHLLKEIQHFFEVYKQLENKVTKITGLKDAATAKELIRTCMNNYQQKFAKN